jgi:hypothetical protein
MNAMPPLSQPDHDPGESFTRAIDWLIDRHRKAIWASIDAELLALAGGDETLLAGCDEELLNILGSTLLEWLWAEGSIEKKGQSVRLADFVLRPGGPQLYPAQWAWLETMTQQPLRLYQMHGLDIENRTVQLHDVLDATLAPYVVEVNDLKMMSALNLSAEIEGKHFLTRVLHTNGRCAISLPYCFFENLDEATLADIRQRMELIPADARSIELSFILRQFWFDQMFDDGDEEDEYCGCDHEMPDSFLEILQATTGEPVRLVTQRYHVSDRDALDRILTKQRDVVGDRECGFSHVIRSSDGATRPMVTVNVGKLTGTVELFSMTLRYADEGRRWFEALAGDLVTFEAREMTDPRDLLTRRDVDRSGHGGPPSDEVGPFRPLLH